MNWAEALPGAVGTFSIALVLLIARVSAFIMAAPIFGHGMTPNMVKFGLCLALSAFWMPEYADVFVDESPSSSLLVILFFFEVLAGFTTGYFIRLIMLPTRVAGAYLGQEIGFNMGQVADPTSGQPTNEAGLLFDALGLVIFWVTDVHHMAFRVLAKATYVTSQNPKFLFDMHTTASLLISRGHENGLLIIAPVATILFVTLIALSLLMRAWPQTTLFTFGMPMRILIGLTAFFLFSPIIIANIGSVYQGMASALQDTVMP